MALLQPRAGPSLHTSQLLSLWYPLRSICHCASPYRPILQSFVYLPIFPRLSSAGQRYVNINSSSVPILETGTLKLIESITAQGHKEESKWQSQTFLLSPVTLSLPSRSPSARFQEPEEEEPDLSGGSCLPGSRTVRKKSPHPQSDHVPKGLGVVALNHSGQGKKAMGWG